jgi:hypothetical protein
MKLDREERIRHQERAYCGSEKESEKVTKSKPDRFAEQIKVKRSRHDGGYQHRDRCTVTSASGYQPKHQRNSDTGMRR